MLTVAELEAKLAEPSAQLVADLASLEGYSCAGRRRENGSQPCKAGGQRRSGRRWRQTDHRRIAVLEPGG